MATADEGMSTSKKVVAGAALGVAIPAAVGAAKKLIGSSGDSDDKSRGRQTPRRQKPGTSKTSSASRLRAKASRTRSTAAKAGSAKRAATAKKKSRSIATRSKAAVKRTG